MSRGTRSHRRKKNSPSIKTLSIDEFEDNPNFQKRAQDELNEIPETRGRDIAALRKMVLAEADLISPTDDAFLLSFLRGYKFDINEAFGLVKKYYNVRVHYPELFVNYRPSSLVHAIKENVTFLLPNTDQHGRTILIVRPANWNPRITPIRDHLTLVHMVMDAAVEVKTAQINGIVIIADLKHLGLTQAIHATPYNAKRGVDLFLDVFPLHVKEIHCIFTPNIFKMVFAVLKLYLNETTAALFHFHGHDLQTLHDYIDPEFLPEEHGGYQPSLQHAAVAQTEYFLARDDEIVNKIVTTGYKRTGR